MIIYEPICLKHNELIQIAKWRNAQMACLRTPTKTHETFEAQAAWVNSIDLDKDRLYFIYEDLAFLGYCGISNINRHYRTGELSMLFDPGKEIQKLYDCVVSTLLKIGIDIINLNCMRIEVYECAQKRLDFIKQTKLFTYWVELPAQKVWNDEFYSSWIGLKWKKLKANRRHE